MIRRRKPNYARIAELERATDMDLDIGNDSLTLEIEKAREAARPKKRDLFKPPILSARAEPFCPSTLTFAPGEIIPVYPGHPAPVFFSSPSVAYNHTHVMFSSHETRRVHLPAGVVI